MDRLKKERSAVRRAFSRIRKTFEDEFKNEDRSFDVLQPIFVQLEYCTMKWNELDRKMMDAILDDEKTTDEALDEEAEKVDEYQMIYLTCRNKIDLVKKDIDAAILKAWSRCRSRREQEHDGEQRTTDLEALMNFIKAEVENEERIQLAHGFTLGKERGSKCKQPESVDYWDFHWTSWGLFIVATFVAIGVAVAVAVGVAIVVAIVVAIDLVPQRLVPEVSSLPGVSMSCGEDRVECGDGMPIWCGDDHIGCGDDHGDIGIRVSIGCGDDRIRCGDDHIWCGDNHLRCGDNHLRCDDGMPSRCADDLFHHDVGVPIWCADIGVICGVGVPIWCVDNPIYK
ncbi:hypothetical protein GE061_011964 [Apolygus lucorum]|uniref:Uncharacterized protein n=1 Tax=Apolygus lucorum TaxID=248454 RepID=A0A8S9XQV9_APOLU|nr:hypothetical protein GE061_011964 [Apolygus lucorum]